MKRIPPSLRARIHIGELPLDKARGVVQILKDQGVPATVVKQEPDPILEKQYRAVNEALTRIEETDGLGSDWSEAVSVREVLQDVASLRKLQAVLLRRVDKFDVAVDALEVAAHAYNKK